DCGKYQAELAGEVAKGKLTLAELDEEEQSLDRLRRWYRAIRARDLFGAPSAPLAERRLKGGTAGLEDFARAASPARGRGAGRVTVTGTRSPKRWRPRWRLPLLQRRADGEGDNDSGCARAQQGEDDAAAQQQEQGQGPGEDGVLPGVAEGAGERDG